jgi:multimeric flavodoxin WrbA
MQEAGAEVEIASLHEKIIKNCTGCFTCWTKTPGKCIHKDDMTRELFPKWLKSDLVVYATPLYHYTVNAEMKAFIERTLPVLEPFFEQRDDRTVHPMRHTPPDAVVLSVAGFLEISVFDQLSNYVNFLFDHDERLLAEIYRPAAESLSRIDDKKKEEIFEATIQAGRELVNSRQVYAETLNLIQQPIIEFETFAQIGNLYWKTCVSEKVTPKEFSEKEMVPRPDSMESFMLIFPFGLNSEAVGARKVILQFNFTGEDTGSCYFIIEKDNISAEKGSMKNPDITIGTPFELWMDIITKKADGQQMYIDQKYKVDGDLALMIQLFQKQNN